jgi:hypothetical protein
MMFREVNGQDRVGFKRDSGGKLVAVIDFPFMVFQEAPWNEKRLPTVRGDLFSRDHPAHAHPMASDGDTSPSLRQTFRTYTADEKVAIAGTPGVPARRVVLRGLRRVLCIGLEGHRNVESAFQPDFAAHTDRRLGRRTRHSDCDLLRPPVMEGAAGAGLETSWSH